MISACLSSVFLSLLIYFFFRNSLLVIALRKSEGDLNVFLLINFLIDGAFLFLLPLVVFSLSGVCVS